QPVLAMKLRAGVAIGARHAALAQMHVAGDAFVQPVVLVLDAAAVAGGTGPAHRRGANDSMPFEQSAANRVRLADVAVAAGGVAVVAVIRLHFFERRVVLGNAALVEGGVVARKVV